MATVDSVAGLKNFRDIIEKDEFSIFDFWATWCGPCRVMAPIFQKLANQHAGKIRFYKVDHDVEEDIVEEIGVRGLPSFVMFRKGQLVGQVIGARPPQLQELIGKAIASLDNPTGPAAEEVKPVTEAKSTEARPIEAKPAEVKPTEAKPTEFKPTENAASVDPEPSTSATAQEIKPAEAAASTPPPATQSSAPVPQATAL